MNTKIFKGLFIVMALFFSAFTMNAQSISGLDNTSFNEGSSPILIDNNVTISGGGDYGGGYILFDLTNGTVNDQLGVTSDANPNASGAISFSGSVLYLGNGSGTDVIGSIDPVQNGQNGQDLKINFTSNFTNSSFENGLGGWTVGKSRVDLGVTYIAGFVTPNDPTNTPYNNNDGDSDNPQSQSYYYQLTTAQHTEGNYSLRLYSNMWTAEGCDVVHGPYVYSAPFQSAAGDVIYFDWRAYAGSDAYDVFGYILNVNTGAKTIVLNTTGQYSSSTNWATASVTIPTSGSYRFVFVSGTYDATCGRAAGASLYIDNVRVFGNKVNATVVSNIARHITYQNNCGSSDATRNLTVSVKNNAGTTASANSTIAINTVAPVAICKNISVQLDANGQATITGADVDNGSSDQCALNLTVTPNTFTCANIGDNNVVMTATDSYGNTSTCNATVTVNYRSTLVPFNALQYVSNGSATHLGNGEYQLTSTYGQYGTVWYQNQMNLGQDFEINGQIYLGNRNAGADGIAFVLQPLSANQGSGGGGIGYAGITPSLAVEFDTYRNYSDPYADHIALTKNGDVNHTTANSLVSPISLGNLEDGNWHTVKILWTASTNNFKVYLDTVLRINYTNNITSTIFGGNSGVFWGFTSATGGEYNDQRVKLNSVSFIEQLDVSAANITDVSCPSNTDGAIDITVTPDHPCYTYSWSNGATTQDISNVGQGSYTVTITDPDGTVLVKTYQVGNADVTPPTINTQPFTLVLDANGNGTLTLNDITSSITDNCGVDQTSFSPMTFNCSNVGPNNVTITSTDVSGNTSTATVVVTVADQTAPNSIAQNLNLNLDANGQVNITAAMIDNGSTDNCGIVSSSLDITSFGCSNIGANTVVLTNTDASGNYSQASATVTISDVTPPNAIAQNLTVQLDASGNASITAAQVDNGSSDNCGIASITVSPSSFTCANVGTNNVTLTVTDNNGNVSTASAVITVVDNIAPSAICKNITVQLDGTGNASITAAQIDNGSNDNCGIASISASQTAFTCADFGANTVVLTVTDVNGNVSTCNATVTVEDNVAPTMSTNDITVQLDVNGFASIMPSDVDNASWDACGIATLVVDPDTFSCADVGANTVTLTATDIHGNVASATAVVTIEDNIAPLVENCPSNITVNNLNNNCFQTVLYTPPTFTDACGIDTFYFSNNAGVVCYQAACCSDKVQGAFPVGVTTITYTAVDVNGNVSTCTFDITVIDTEPPVLNNVPADITMNVDPGTCQKQFVYWTPPTPSDNCPSWNMTASHFPGQTFPVGTTTVSYTLSDNAGQTVVGSFDITIIDNEAPNAICQNKTIYLDANGAASILASDIDNGSTDNCGIQSITLSQYNFDCSHVGVNSVTMTVMDIHGNSSTCQTQVTVVDNTNPMVIAQNITVNLNANGAASITAADVDNGSYDNCSFTLAVSPSSFDCSNTGANTVTLTATDASGNVSTATAIVTVEDNIAPTVLTQNITVYLDANGSASITTADVDNGTYDNCSFTLGVAPFSFDCSNTGANTVVLTATDASGNVSTANATVTVVDNISPTVLTQSVTVYLDANGSASITTADINNGSFDNCSIASLSLDKTTFDCSETGANTVNLTAVDPSGNTSSATATVTVIDDINPVISGCPADVTVYADPNNCSNVATWTAPTAADNCSIASFTSNYNSGDVFGLGTHTVTYTAVDPSGNTANCSFQVIVLATPLTISAVSSDFNGNGISCNGAADGSIDVSMGGGCLPYTYSWSNGASTEDLSNLTAGTYVLNATDANGATISITVTLTEPTELKASLSSPTFNGGWNISCNGANDGNVSASISGGTAPYAVVWNNGATSQNLSNIGSGTYTVVISDANGCSTTESITLTEPQPMASNIVSTSYAGGFNISCNGLSDGDADLSVAGGTAPYVYTWSNGSAMEDLSGISAGTYTVNITDANNCQSTASVTITQPDVLTVNPRRSPTICEGESVLIGGGPTATGGASPYTYAWNPASSLNDATVSNPIASPVTTTTYAVHVNDANGCYAAGSYTVNVNPRPVVSIDASGVVNCDKVTLEANTTSNVSGYIWSTGEYTPSIEIASDLSASGNYSLTIYDDKGCASLPASYTFDPTVFANAYTIIAKTDMNLGEKNYVESGSVGLTGNGRTAKVMKYAEINGTGAFLKADKMDVKTGAVVPTRFYDPANPNMPLMYYYTSSNISGTINVPNNANVTINGEGKNIKIGRNATVTLNGSNFGYITMEKYSKLTFTSNLINMKKFSNKKSTANHTSEINFSADTKVKVQQEMKVEAFTVVNGSQEYQVNFYIGEKCQQSDEDDDHHGDDGNDDDENDGNCDGKVTQLKLKYTGNKNHALVQIYQKKDHNNLNCPIYSGYVSNGQSFTFNGVDDKGTMGTEIQVYVNGYKHTSIHTSCSKPIGIGSQFGDFEVIGGKSRNGGSFNSVSGSKGNDIYGSRHDDDDDDEHGDDGDDDDGDDDHEGDCGYKGLFYAHGKGLVFNASVMVPRGQINVHHSATSTYPGYFVGQYIADKFNSEGSYIHWNWNSCSNVIIVPPPVTRVTQDANTTIKELSLKVYPNPTTQNAFVEFEAPKAEVILVEVYNMVGQKVKTLYNKEVSEGENIKIKLNGNDFEMGVYYIKLVADNKVYSEKITFLR